MCPQNSYPNNYRFQTKELHPKSKLVYFGARWYNPAVGRWLTPDPAGIIDGPNLYVYLNNSPTNLLDPWGLCGAPPWGKEWWVKDKKIVVRSNRQTSPWWDRWFWVPRGEKKQIWTWQIDYTLPPSSIISAGWIGSVQVYWKNQSHYEQWGRWKWDSSEYNRSWNYQSGKKSSGPTEGMAWPSGPTHEIIIIAPKPNENPEP